MYSKIKVYGRQNVNYVWCKTGTSDNAEVNNVDSKGIYTPIWDSNTVALATFSDDISAASVSGEQSIIGYRIHRKNEKEDILYNVATVSSENTIIDDYNVSNRSSYKYYITPIFDNDGHPVLGLPVITDVVEANWASWSVVGMVPTDDEDVYLVDNSNVWNFGLNLQSGSYNLQSDKTFTAGLNKFPRVSVGSANYLEGSLQTLMGHISSTTCTYTDSMEMIEAWERFCNNGQLKLLKDIKGRVLPIEIKETSIEYMDDTMEQIANVSFSFVQLDDSKNLSVYGLVVE